MRFRPFHLAIIALLLPLVACGFTIGGPTGSSRPFGLTPQDLRDAYGVTSLIQQGFTGKGQTVIDIVSYGSPTLQQDMDVFDQQFGLPAITLKVLAPLGTVPFDTSNPEMTSWAGETELDVQLIHAIAPEANIVVMTSPVDETEGTAGVPEFMQLEQYAVAHHLGLVFSQSWTASEATLTDSASQQIVQGYADFYRQTTRQGFTYLNASGDNGATDCAALDCLSSSGEVVKLAPTPTVGFPVDVPWVTGVGGTTLNNDGTSYTETAWEGSGGGASQFFALPEFQQGLPDAAKALLNGQRGLPDVAADADPETGMSFYHNGGWDLTGGTSAAAPVWAGIIAIADQMAGHGLGDINPGLYKLGASATAARDFRDVTSGDNSNDTHGVHVQGFAAVSGWDPVTGWGTPLADHLIPDLVAALK
jgi:subtilase family serine protease